VQDGPLINFPPTVGLDIAAALAEHTAHRGALAAANGR